MVDIALYILLKTLTIYLTYGDYPKLSWAECVFIDTLLEGARTRVCKTIRTRLLFRENLYALFLNFSIYGLCFWNVYSSAKHKDNRTLIHNYMEWEIETDECVWNIYDHNLKSFLLNCTASASFAEEAYLTRCTWSIPLKINFEKMVYPTTCVEIDAVLSWCGNVGEIFLYPINNFILFPAYNHSLFFNEYLISFHIMLLV